MNIPRKKAEQIPWSDWALTLTAFIIILVFFRFAADDYSAFDFGAAAGQFSDYPYCDYYFLGLIGLADMYVFLYKTAGEYNWMGLSWIVFGLLSLYVSLRTIRSVALADMKNPKVVWCIQGLFTLFFLENLASVSHTRFSLVFCGLALVNLIFRKKLNLRQHIGYALLFVFGMLVRPESALGMLLLVGGGYLIYRFRIFHAIKRFWMPVLATVIMLSAILYDIAHSDLFVKKMEPEIEYSFMDKRVVDLSEMKTRQDSVKYRVAVAGQWFDPEVVTPDYMRTLIKPGPNLSKEHREAVFWHLMQPYGQNFPLIVTQVLLALLCLFRPGRRWVFVQILCLVGFTFLLLYALDYNGFLVSGRHFLGIQLISLLMAFRYYFDEEVTWPHLTIQLPAYLAGLLLVCGAWHTWKTYRNTNAQLNAVTHDMQVAMAKLEEIYSGRIVVVTNDSRYWLDRDLTIKNHIYTKNTYILFDHGTYNLVPRYVDYLKRLSGVDIHRPAAFFRWLSANNALYMGDPVRFDLTRDYMQAVHGQTLEFADPVNINRLANIKQFTTQDYEIRTIKVIE